MIRDIQRIMRRIKYNFLYLRYKYFGIQPGGKKGLPIYPLMSGDFDGDVLDVKTIYRKENTLWKRLISKLR